MVPMTIIAIPAFRSTSTAYRKFPVFIKRNSRPCLLHLIDQPNGH